MSAVEDEQAVGALFTYRAYEPLGVRVAVRAPRRDLGYGDALAGEDGIEGGRERCAPVADQVGELGCAVAELPEQLADLLGRPGGGGVSGDAEVLTAAGVDPAPHRSGPTWREFLTAQAGSIVACDFLHIDLVSLRRVYALVFLEHGTRRVHVAGVTAHPTAQWTAQQARNLALDEGVRLESLRFLIRDRDSKYTESFDAVFEAEGIETLKTAPRSPRMNAHCERVVGTLRCELLDHALITAAIWHND